VNSRRRWRSGEGAFAAQDSPAIQKRVQSFYASVPEICEDWITRSENPNTQQSYGRAVMADNELAGIS
jgi:hypothetical protein